MVFQSSPTPYKVFVSPNVAPFTVISILGNTLLQVSPASDVRAISPQPSATPVSRFENDIVPAAFAARGCIVQDLPPSIVFQMKLLSGNPLLQNPTEGDVK